MKKDNDFYQSIYSLMKKKLDYRMDEGNDAQLAVALPFSFFSAKNTRRLKMIIIVRGIFRHFSLHEGQEKQPSLGPQFHPEMFTFS